MPAGNFQAYFNKAGSFLKKGISAGKGRATSMGVTRTATGASSGVMKSVKNNRVAQAVAKRPYKSAAIGMGAMGVGGYALQGRSGRGVDKFRGGRPTGMYGR